MSESQQYTIHHIIISTHDRKASFGDIGFSSLFYKIQDEKTENENSDNMSEKVFINTAKHNNTTTTTTFE